VLRVLRHDEMPILRFELNPTRTLGYFLGLS
jgi:hypothetical protein